jgi:putative transposase
VWLYRLRPQLLDTWVLVKPATVIGWHRKGFHLHWRWRSRRSGRSKTNAKIRDLIRRMSSANPFWGAPRIRGELVKLGVDVSQAIIGRYLLRRQHCDRGRFLRVLYRVTIVGMPNPFTARYKLKFVHAA